MAFDKKTWANNQGGGTPLDASGLNDLESRITDSIDELDKGVIVESGSNANGSYVKFADGTMICWQRHSVNQAVSIAWGNGLFSSGPVAMPPYPASFIEIPVAVAFVDSNHGTVLPAHSAVVGSVTSVGSLEAIRGTALGSFPLNFSVIAIGRWR